MRFYELTYLISPDLSEEEIKVLQEKIKSLIQEEEGLLNKEGESIKERLAYPIKKNNTAISMTINFQLEPEKLTNLEKKIKSEKCLLRYIILAKKLPKKALPEIPFKPAKEIIKPFKPKVELKEIEKKLEEILGQ